MYRRRVREGSERGRVKSLGLSENGLSPFPPTVHQRGGKICDWAYNEEECVYGEAN